MNEPTFEVPAGQRQLFLDDRDIAKIDNLTRTMRRPAKKGPPSTLQNEVE